MSEIYLGKPSKAIEKWCKEKYPVHYNGPLYFTSNENNSSIILLCFNSADHVISSFAHIQYSTDEMKTWLPYGHQQTLYFKDCENNKVYFRADPENPNISGFYDLKTYRYHKFGVTKSTCVYGNIQYLLTSDGKQTTVPVYAFKRMFQDMQSLRTAPLLPGTTLGINCYEDTFRNCGISGIVDLPATSISLNCYKNMFYNCNSINEVNMNAGMDGIYNSSIHGVLKNGIKINYNL